MESRSIQGRLKLAILLTFLVLSVEVVGGLMANSLALLSDAAHMFMDTFSLCLSWFALKISDRPSTRTQTYGYHRVEIFVALFNGMLLFILSVGILYEAIQRFSHPEEIKTGIVIAVAIVGLLTNLLILYFLRLPLEHTHDLNLKSAFYHVVGDSLASVGVIVGGVVMIYTGWYAVDAVVGASIGLLLIWGAKSLIFDSLHVLLEGVPKGISTHDVERELTSIPAIKDIHELHIWSICSNIYALSTHALVNDQKINEVDPILNEVRRVLKEKFNISHTTIQFESSPCSDAGIPCVCKH